MCIRDRQYSEVFGSVVSMATVVMLHAVECFILNAGQVGSEWVLVGVANNSQQGTSERVKEKMQDLTLSRMDRPGTQGSNVDTVCIICLMYLVVHKMLSCLVALYLCIVLCRCGRCAVMSQL